MATKAHSLSVRDRWARHHIDRALKRAYIKHFGELPKDGNLPPPQKLDISPPRLDGAPPKVCIIGAGAAGLFTAMLFDYLNANVSGFQVGYDIFEAAAETNPARGKLPRNGIGGRLFTYNFSDTPHDYYDVGAMRFPQNPVMLRTFCLFEHLNMPQVPSPDGNTPIGSLIPYYMNGNGLGAVEPWRFNDINATGDYTSIATAAKPTYDPFQLSSDKTDPIPEAVLQFASSNPDGTDGVIGYIMAPYITELVENPNGPGFEFLMNQDGQSTNTFLQTTPELPTPTISRPFDYNTIEWLETFNGGTSWYDQANSETILEFLDFDYPEVPPNKTQ